MITVHYLFFIYYYIYFIFFWLLECLALSNTVSLLGMKASGEYNSTSEKGLIKFELINNYYLSSCLIGKILGGNGNK